MLHDFLDHLLSFNPFWAGGAVIFGFLMGQAIKKGTLVFMLFGYALFVIPTLKAKKMLEGAGIASEINAVANNWGMTPYYLHSAIVALGFILLAGVFWALNQRPQN